MQVAASFVNLLCTGISGQLAGMNAVVWLIGAVVDDPKAWVDLRRIRVGDVGWDQTESSTGVHGVLLAIREARLLQIHLEDLR